MVGECVREMCVRCEGWIHDGGSEQECVMWGEGGRVQTRSCFIPPSSARSTLVSTKTVRCPGGGVAH